MLNVLDDEIRPLTSFQKSNNDKKSNDRTQSNKQQRKKEGPSNAARNKSSMVDVTTVNIFVMQLCEANCRQRSDV
jgi:hypothetical protein